MLMLKNQEVEVAVDMEVEVENAKISTMRRNALRSRMLVNVRIKLLRNV